MHTLAVWLFPLSLVRYHKIQIIIIVSMANLFHNIVYLKSNVRQKILHVRLNKNFKTFSFLNLTKIVGVYYRIKFYMRSINYY